ncbi:MAG: hypothetical protein AB7T49_11030 [Oligoflexales bacterium]
MFGHQASKKTLVLAALCAFSVTSCFQSVFDSAGTVDGTASIKNVKAVAGDNGKVTVAVDIDSTATQTFEVTDDENLAGTSVSFPPGSLNVSTAITIEQSASLEDSVLADLELTDNSVSVAGSGVIIRPAASTAAALKPFTIQLPVPGSSLRLQSNLANLAVLYHVWQSDGGKLVGGVLPFSALKVVDGIVYFDTKFFGAYQVMIMAAEIEETVEVTTEEPIRNISNVAVVNTSGVVPEEKITQAEALDPLAFEPATITYIPTVRKVKVVSKQKSGFALTSCKAEIRKDPGIFYGEKKDTGLGTEAEFFISDLSSTSIVGQISCVDEHGRLGLSAWSSPVKVPGVVPTMSYSTTERKLNIKGDTLVSFADRECKAYLSGSANMNGGQTSGVINYLDYRFPVNVTGSVVLYGRFSCKDPLGNITYSATSKPLTVYGSINITPPVINVTSAGSRQLTVNGGVGPYTWDIWKLDDPYTHPYSASISKNGPNTALYDVDYMSGIGDIIEVTDSNGDVAIATAYYVMPLSGSPSAQIRAGQSLDLFFSGGIQPYTFSVVSGAGSVAKLDPTTARYTAPTTATTAQVRVTDKQGWTFPTTINVRGSGDADPSFNYGEAGRWIYTMGLRGGFREFGFVPGTNYLALGGFIDDTVDSMAAVQIEADNGFPRSPWGNVSYPGNQVSSFGGTTSVGQAMTVLGDGSMIVAGQAWGTTVPDLDATVLKFTPTGAVDNAFGGSGFSQINISASDEALAVKEMVLGGVSRIIVAGRTGGTNAFIAMIKSDDGTLDASFNGGSVLSLSGMSIIHDIYITPGNEIIAVGKGSSPNYYMGYARVSSTGTVLAETDFGFTGIAHRVKPIPAGLGGGYIIAGGRYYSGFDYKWVVARLDSSFNLVTGFGTGGYKEFDFGAGTDMVHGIAVSSTGKLYLVGSNAEENNTGGMAVIQRVQLSDGALDTGWHGGAHAIPNAYSTVWYNDVVLLEGVPFPRVYVLGEAYQSETSFVHVYIP